MVTEQWNIIGIAEREREGGDREKEIQINKSMMMEKSLFSILVKDE